MTYNLPFLLNIAHLPSIGGYITDGVYVLLDPKGRKTNNNGSEMMEKKYECECGRTISESDWLFLNKNYGEMPVCGCIKCHACDVMVNPNNDPNNELKNVLCEEAGWITLCKDCPLYTPCDMCEENVLDAKIVVIDVASVNSKNYNGLSGMVRVCVECLPCYKCGKQGGKFMVVGENAGYYDHVCINDEGETYNCDE